MSLNDVIHRAELPIDGRPHGIDLYSEILHAAVRRPGHVDVWYIARPTNVHHMRRSFQIIATGQTFPAWLGRHHKTAITPDGQSEWHVVESHCTHEYVTETPDMRDRKDRVPGFCDECGVHLVGDSDGGWTPRCPMGLS